MRLAGARGDQDWKDFFEDLKGILHLLDGVRPAWAGIPPKEYRELGSVLDSLGGFVSTIGELTPLGFRFPIEHVKRRYIREALPQIAFEDDWQYLLVPLRELRAFSNLVSIRGPLADDIDMLEELRVK